MSEEIEQSGDQEEASSGKSGKKIGIIVALLVLLLGGGVGVTYFMGMFDSMLGKEEKTEEHPAEEAAAAVPAAKITYYELPEFLLNLNSTTGQTSFIKMKVSLRLPSEADQLIAQERLAELQNEFNTYLRDLRASDLSGSAGMYRLQEELLARANRVLGPEGKVDKILFTQILIQ